MRIDPVVARALVGSLFLTLAGSCLALAASVPWASGSIGASRVSTPRCTNAGLLVLPNLAGAAVASVTVSSLPAACGGATVQAAVHNGATSSNGSAVVPVGGGSVTVTLPVAVAVTTGQQLDVVLIGP